METFIAKLTADYYLLRNKVINFKTTHRYVYKSR